MKNTTNEKWLLALHEVARLIARDVPENNPPTDGECLDEVWEYLTRLGINPDAYRPTITAPPEDANRLFIGTCDTCASTGTVYFTGGIGNDETVCLPCYGSMNTTQRAVVQAVTQKPEALKKHPVLQKCASCLCTVVLTVTDYSDPDRKLCWDCYWDTPAPFAAAGAAQNDASPAPEAPASKEAQASSACTGGDFGGWVVYCCDGSSEWIEGTFPDQDSAERFAKRYRLEGDYTATPLLIMTTNREEWSK